MDGQWPGKNQVPETIGIISKVIGGGVGLVFAGVGITVLIFLWGAPFNEFDSPPLFFRIVGSFIAIAFVLMGGGTFLGMLLGGNVLKRFNRTGGDNPDPNESMQDNDSANSPTSYTCPRCGAPLGKGAEVSPHGDTKCGYCNAWFNIH
jgi:hypothetical protein